MLYPEANLKAEWDADAPLRRALGLTRPPKQNKPPTD